MSGTFTLDAICIGAESELIKTWQRRTSATSSVSDVFPTALIGLFFVILKSSSIDGVSSAAPVITTRTLRLASSSQSLAKFSRGHCFVGQRSDEPGLMPTSVWLFETH